MTDELVVTTVLNRVRFAVAAGLLSGAELELLERELEVILELIEKRPPPTLEESHGKPARTRKRHHR